jgi:hypothetical protein
MRDVRPKKQRRTLESHKKGGEDRTTCPVLRCRIHRGFNAKISRTSGSEAATDPNAYFVDVLLRSNPITTDRNDVMERGMVQRTFNRALRQRDMSSADKTYLAQVAAARTGMSESEAGKRVRRI